MGDRLEAWVMHDHKPITARLLAVKQRIHVEEARKQMHALLDSHANSSSKPYATWLLMGEMAPISAAATSDSQGGQTQDSMDLDASQSQSQGGYTDQQSVPRMGMVLTDDTHLEDCKTRFSSTPNVQLYALSPPLPAKDTVVHRIAAVSALTTIQHDLKNDAAYVKTWQETEHGAELGAIKAPSDIRQVGKDPIPPLASTSKTPAAPAVAVKKEPQPAKAAAAQLKVATKKEEAKVAPAKKEEKKPAATKKDAKAPSKPKRKLVDSDDEEDEKPKVAAMEVDDEEDDGPIGYADAPAKEAAPKLDSDEAGRKRADGGDKPGTKGDDRRRRRQELMDMMDSDGDQDPEVGMAASASTSVMKGNAEPKKASKAFKKEKKPAAKDMPSTEADEGVAAEEKPGTKGPKRRVRKQRKVTRKETTRNEKGYRVTRDVEEYESYSSDESSEDEKKTKSKAKPRKSANSAASSSKDDAEKAAAPAPGKMDTATEKAQDATKDSPAPISEAKKETPAPVAAKKTAAGGNTNASSTAAAGQRKLSSFFTKKK